MIVGFLSNQVDGRGTSHALYDYAHYNETILGNRSTIFSLDTSPRNPSMEKKLYDRFRNINHIEDLDDVSGVNVLYHIKSGTMVPKPPPVDRYAVHAVFDISHPHGDRFAAISKWLADDKVPFVPHIIQVEETQKSYREMIGIPPNAIVFGRYGALDTFDIEWVWPTILTALAERDDIWFLFANTESTVTHDHIVYMNELKTPIGKAVFINTCDYMIHARARGETFGISVGEFGSQGKPVVTYNKSPERAHIQELGSCALLYDNARDLHSILKTLLTPDPCYSYGQFTPEEVMKKFQEVFLD